jgi:hypothetical protein
MERKRKNMKKNEKARSSFERKNKQHPFVIWPANLLTLYKKIIIIIIIKKIIKKKSEERRRREIYKIEKGQFMGRLTLY